MFKNIIKLIIAALLLLPSLSLAQDKCELAWKRFLKDTDYTTVSGKKLSDAIDANPDLMDAWKVVDESGIDQAIKTDPDELSKVLDKLEEIEQVGGYAKWKSLGRADNLAELTTAFKSRLNSRVAQESGMTMRYADDEIKAIIDNGKKLDLPEKEIEDIIFNGCRDSKKFTKDELISQSNYWKTVKDRGYPNLFESLNEYERFGGAIKDLARKWNLPENSIFVQGSSLRVSDASKIGDLDVAIKVDASTFDKLTDRFFESTTSVGRQGTITQEAAKGRISAGNMFSDSQDSGSFIGQLRNKLDVIFNPTFSGKTKVSIVKESSKIDVSPYLKVK